MKEDLQQSLPKLKHHHVCEYCGQVFEYDFQKERHIEEKNKADNSETTSDQNKNFPRTSQRNRKKCSLQ